MNKPKKRRQTGSEEGKMVGADLELEFIDSTGRKGDG